MKLFKIVAWWRMTATITMVLTLVGSSLIWTVAPSAAQTPRAQLCAEVSFRAGFDGDALVTAVAIALAESRCNPAATGYSYPAECTQSIDRGLFQIGTCGHPGVSDSCAYDAQCNANAAFLISAQGTNWRAWSATYDSGIYLSFLAEAQAAVDPLIRPLLPRRPVCHAVTGDWNGDGVETLGVACRSGHGIAFDGMNVHRGGSPQVSGGFGNSDSCLPVTGDWNGDGIDTLGAACKSGHGIRWSLTNGFSGSPSYPEFGFGNSDVCQPVTGDWNGDGVDSVGVACKSGSGIAFDGMNVHRGGSPQVSGGYGNSGVCRPVTGDWNGDGVDTLGAACRSGHGIRWSLTNGFSGSPSYPEFGFGNSDICRPVTGDWDGNGTTTIGVACKAGHGLAWDMMNAHRGGSPQIEAGFGNGDTYRPTGGWGGPAWPTWPHN